MSFMKKRINKDSNVVGTPTLDESTTTTATTTSGTTVTKAEELSSATRALIKYQEPDTRKALHYTYIPRGTAKDPSGNAIFSDVLNCVGIPPTTRNALNSICIDEDVFTAIKNAKYISSDALISSLETILTAGDDTVYVHFKEIPND